MGCAIPRLGVCLVVLLVVGLLRASKNLIPAVVV